MQYVSAFSLKFVCHNAVSCQSQQLFIHFITHCTHIHTCTHIYLEPRYKFSIAFLHVFYLFWAFFYFWMHLRCLRRYSFWCACSASSHTYIHSYTYHIHTYWWHLSSASPLPSIYISISISISYSLLLFSAVLR